MRYIKPEYFDEFKCIADKCPDTCCAGWQIIIDEASLERYEEEASSFGEHLRKSIDWQEGVFRHKGNRRCAFLNEQNLCDLYTALGADALCDTCRDYPRHTEEFEGLRELSLSLSCPVAAEIILSAKAFPAFIEYETDEPEELADEFEDFDLLLFSQLEEARKAAFEILKSSQISFENKLQKVLELAKEIDDCVGEGRFSDIDEVLERYGDTGEKAFGDTSAISKESAACEELQQQINSFDMNRYQLLKDNFPVLNDMELLRDDWKEIRDKVWNCLYAGGEEKYNQIAERFKKKIKKEGIQGIPLECIATNLMVTFVYTWFCGAVYSGWVYSKMAMAAFCTCYILEFVMAEWALSGEQITFNKLVEITYRFTREVEHSDINLGILEEWFIDDLT